VLLVDLPDTPGGAATVEIVPTQASTPFVKELLDGEEAVDQFCGAAASPLLLGEVTISGISASRWAAVQARLRDAAPRVRLLWATARPAATPVAASWSDLNDPLAIVRAHLDKQYQQQPEQRDRLLAALQQLLATEDISEAEVSA